MLSSAWTQPNLSIVDPICTFLFSILVLLTTVRIVRDCLHVLMEGMLAATALCPVLVMPSSV